MSTLQIGPKYFKNERKSYADWKQATCREMLQNANDSRGCTRIDINTGNDKIGMRDNGAGMTKEVLENTFLVLGESTKGDGETGGFGIARNLICFASESYVIQSDNYIARGRGANYEVLDSRGIEFRGCEFVIETENHDWISEFKGVLDLSDLKPAVYINGEKYVSEPHRARWVRDLSFGKVYVNKSAANDKGNVLVCRINGLFMFSKYISAKARVFVEIDPLQSKKVLTSNRDGLQFTQQRELDAFLNELASETVSALKPRRELFNRIYNRGKGFAAVAKRANVTSDFEKETAIAARTVSVGVDVSRLNFLGIELTNEKENNEKRIEFTDSYSDPITRYSIIVNEESDFEAISKKYDPSALDSTSTRYKLLATWFRMIEKLAAENAKMVGDFVWGIGFIFSKDCEAQFRNVDGVNYFLLNPIDAEQKMRYSINNNESLGEMLALCVHEIAHCHNGNGCGGHDESFASRMTDLTKKVNASFREYINTAKGKE